MEYQGKPLEHLAEDGASVNQPRALLKSTLPGPEEIDAGRGNGSRLPSTPVEKMLTTIWEEVLGRTALDLDTDFFEAGGHSLLVTQVLSRAQQAFQVELPIRCLFEYPTIEELASYIQTKSKFNENTPGIPVRASSQSSIFPLSFAQERLWFLNQLAPANPFYNLFDAWLLEGSLQIQALERSFDELVARHEILRTTFVANDGRPEQIIAPHLALPFSLVDLQAIDETARETLITRILVQSNGYPFDLTRGPLVSVTLLRVAKDAYVLLLCMHHIIFDGWSRGIFIRELTALYNAFSHQKPSPLPPLAIQYADFSLWQRQWMQGEVLEKLLNYWMRQIQTKSPLLNLPADYQRPHLQSFEGASCTFTLAEPLTRALKKRAQEQNATLFMVLLTAFQVLLYRYTGQHEIIVGTDVANRTRQEIEGLIGFFVNQMALCSKLSDETTFHEALAQTREMTFEAYAHQDLPFEKLVEKLQPERSLSYSPLFQVKFVLQNAPQYPFGLANIQVKNLEANYNTAKFDLTLLVQEDEETLQGTLEYNIHLFKRATIERMIGYFQVLLQGIVAHPDQKIATYPLLSKAEEQQLLFHWNERQTQVPDEPLPCCIQQWFEEQASRVPHAIAAIYDDTHITYQELNRRANQLARYLRARGVRAEVCVGIYLDRSLEWLTGILGILKAGGTYVPLDPSYPQERIAFMLSDSEVSLLLTQERLQGELMNYAGDVFCMDRNWPELESFSQVNFLTEVQAENTAYVIYTSGSTGKPKGVAVTHHNLLLSTRTRRAFYRASAGRLLVLPSFAFDSSVAGIFWMLCSGGSLFLPRQELAQDVEHLAQFLVEQGISHWISSPSLYSALLTQSSLGKMQSLTSLCEVIVAGEPCTRELTQHHAEVFPQASLFNEYGVTECSIWSTVHAVSEEGEAFVPVGTPVAHARIFILDAYQQPVPVGVAGELYIGGPGVTRGYIKHPDLTAERFIPDLFSQTPGARLYRTGDRARWLASGEIQILGRVDYQVKLRGFRIEPGEIEALLQQHPALRASVVLIREDRPGNQRLVAYVVFHEGQEETFSALQAFLVRSLPDYMVPTAFVRLDALPLTTNGKVDRQNLPAPESIQPVGKGDDETEPQSTGEIILSEIWCEVLGLDQVSVRDNFFNLGGHSLLVAQVRARIREQFQRDLPLQSFFEHPTIEALASILDTEKANSERPAMPKIEIVSRNQRLPLSFAQQRLWFMNQLEPGNPFYNAFHAVRIKGIVNIEALERSLAGVLARHEILHTRFRLVEEKLAAVVAVVSSFPFLLIDAQDVLLSETGLNDLLNEAIQLPFDLAQDHLLRIYLVRVASHESILLFTMHHIISDGWSMDLLLQELAKGYNACLTGIPYTFPSLPLQYVDYAVWQQRWLQGETLSRLLSYWKRQLQQAPPLLNLPTDHPRLSVQQYRGASQPMLISEALTQALRELGHAEEATLFMTLMTAFALLLHFHAEQEDIVIGTEVANRPLKELEGLIGFFVNMLAVRSTSAGDPSFTELLARMRTTILAAYAHQDLPFEKVVEELQPERTLSYHPVFQVVFVFQSIPRSTDAFSGLKLEQLEMPIRTARYDLVLDLKEEEHGLQGRLDYNSDLFEQSTIVYFLQGFQAILEQVTQQKDLRLSALNQTLSHLKKAWVVARRKEMEEFGSRLLKKRQSRQATISHDKGEEIL